MVAVPHHPEPLRMTETEYLEFEQSSDLKHEFFEGEVYAMTGASRAHNQINVNLIRILSTHLREKNCEVYPSDMRVKIGAAMYTYPDVSVVCGDAKFSSDGGTDNLTNPTLIIEILSPSTEGYDRGKKFQNYRKLGSLREYILVAQDSPHIEHYQLQQGLWHLKDVEGLSAQLKLESVDCVLSLAGVYERVNFTGE